MDHKYDVGVLVMRMQVDAPTKPHRELLDYVQKHHGKMLVVLGVSGLKQPSKNNPLDYPTRECMVREIFPVDRFPHVRVIGLPDEEYDDKWSAHLDDRIEMEFPHHTVALYGGRDSFKGHYNGKFPMGEVPDEIRSLDESSGTNTRHQIGRMVVPQAPQSVGFLEKVPILGEVTPDIFRTVLSPAVAQQIGIAFRQGAIYTKQHEFDKINATVDIAILRYNANAEFPWSFLSGKKKVYLPSRFPGGFSDPAKDESYEDGAIREGFEETNIQIARENLHYIGSYRIHDWRCPPNEGIMTHFNVAMMPEDQKEIPGDDIVMLEWLTLYPDVMPAHLFEPCHAVLYKALVKFLENKTPDNLLLL